MSTPPPAAAPAPKKPAPSAAGRYLFVFLLGLVVGIVAVVMVMRAIEQRRTWQDQYPHALMQLLHAQSAQLGAGIEANRCAATDILPRLQSLRSLANDLEPAFPDLRDDGRFTAHASRARRVLDAGIAAPPADCAAARALQKTLGDSCAACHQDFSG